MIPRRHLFIGPSIPDAEQLLSGTGILLHPPIAAGELLRLGVRRGDVVGIVDGYFHDTRAVRHKEIFAVLSEGVRVLGASSIGALRAAELDRYGMEGIGGIYTDYREGRLEADDEVALLHGPAETGYRPFSVPLVSMRSTLEGAVRQGLCETELGQRLIDAMRKLPYMDRTYARLIDEGTRAGMTPAKARALGRFCREHAIDRKRQDALLLVDSMRDDVKPAAEREAPSLHRTIFLYGWQLEARGEQRADGWISDLAALRVCQLFATDYPEFFRRRVFEHLAAECDRECGDDRAQVDEAPDARARAIAHGVHRGVYRRERGALGFLDSWLTPEERASDDVDVQLARFLVRSFLVAPGIVWDEGVLDSLRGTPPFRRAQELARAAETLNETARQRHRAYSVGSLSKDRVREWLAKHWGVAPDALESAARDRGLSTETLIEAARPYYLLGKYNSAIATLRMIE